MTTYKPGSFFLAAAEGWQGYGIALGQALAGSPSRYTHAGIIVAEDGTCVEAEPGGARYGNVAAYRHALVSDAPVREWLRDKGYTRGAQLDATAERVVRNSIVDKARALIGTGYSALDYLALALLHLHLPSLWVRRRVEKSGRAICSQLVDLCYQRAGIHLYDDGRFPGDVMPSDLAAWAEDHEVAS